MILDVEGRRDCYKAFEAVLQRAGLDYEVHMLPTREPTDYEEYWITNEEPPVKLFPAPAAASAESRDEVASLAREVLEAHSAQVPGLAYYVVLCGSGWTAADAMEVRSSMDTIGVPRPEQLTVMTLEQLEAAGL